MISRRWTAPCLLGLVLAAACADDAAPSSEGNRFAARSGRFGSLRDFYLLEAADGAPGREGPLERRGAADRGRAGGQAGGGRAQQGCLRRQRRRRRGRAARAHNGAAAYIAPRSKLPYTSQ